MKKENDNIRNSGTLPAPEPYMSGVRYLVNHAHGTEYKPLEDFKAGKNCDKSYIVFEGDHGGQIYLTCPMKYVKCSPDTLAMLLSDIDTLHWNEMDGSGLYYEEFEVDSGVCGGMGGGVAIDGLWVHDELLEEGLYERIADVIIGKSPKLINPGINGKSKVNAL
jgi:hypothetical protein